VITNKEIDAVLITQLSSSNTVLLEIEYKNTKAFIVSAYFDITNRIEDELNRFDQILELTKKHGIVIAVDSNSRSAAWHIKTNKRGKILEEYMISKDLYVMNESSKRTLLYNARGQSNIDLTIVNKPLLKAIAEWDISDKESCSDHSIIKFSIGESDKPGRQHTLQRIRYKINEKNLRRFDSNLKELLAKKFQKNSTEDSYRPR
jgi:hypothetical protein